MQGKFSTDEDADNFISKARNNGKITSTDSLGFLVLIAVGLGGINILFNLILTFWVSGLANKPTPALVQLADGKTIKIATLSDKERTPQVIKDFTSLTMTKLMTWRGTLPPITPEELTNPKLDPGVSIAGKDGSSGGKVPTLAYQSSYALSSDFQNPFLEQLAKLATQISGSTRTETALEILNMGTPVETAPGSWRVSMVANILILQQGTSLPRRMSFNKDVYVHAVPVPRAIEGGNAKDKAISELIATSRSSGLEIFGIRDYERKDLKSVN
jgi:hypothetical protein